LRVLVEYLLPLCRVGGAALAQKGESAASEAAAAAPAIDALGGGEPRLSAVRLPQTDQTHYLIVIPKTRPTGDQYPRRPGLPAKRPL
jgi:16S rRNA (guanine527-N7)-methyltransferase